MSARDRCVCAAELVVVGCLAHGSSRALGGLEAKQDQPAEGMIQSTLVMPEMLCPYVSSLRGIARTC